MLRLCWPLYKRQCWVLIQGGATAAATAAAAAPRPRFMLLQGDPMRCPRPAEQVRPSQLACALLQCCRPPRTNSSSPVPDIRACKARDRHEPGVAAAGQPSSSSSSSSCHALQPHPSSQMGTLSCCLPATAAGGWCSPQHAQHVKVGTLSGEPRLPWTRCKVALEDVQTMLTKSQCIRSADPS